MFRSDNKLRYLKYIITVFFATIGAVFLLFFVISNLVNGDMLNGDVTEENRGGVPVPQQIAAESEQGVNISQQGANISQQGANISQQGASITETVAKSASPGVVGISVLKVDSSSIFDGNAARKWGLGSGVIVSPDGYILTNHHVAGGKNSRIVVHLEDGRDIDGITVWSDPVLDLAVVKVDLTGLPVIPLGDANKLKVGEPAIAIGNPLGLQFQRTVTSGIINALTKTISIETEQGSNYMEDLIQTDASINPGNSGGPLLNSRGEVIGINTVKVESAEAIGFAVPINIAVPVIQKITQTGEFTEPYLGVFAYDREVVPYLDGNIKIDKGIYVVNLDESAPAYQSGIRLGCVITQVDGNDVNTMMQLRCYLY
jgi:serine protease Do